MTGVLVSFPSWEYGQTGQRVECHAYPDEILSVCKSCGDGSGIDTGLGNDPTSPVAVTTYRLVKDGAENSGKQPTQDSR